MTRDGEESVLSRWSRRKHEAEQPVQVPQEPVLPETEDTQLDVMAETEPKPLLTDADMPDIETLDSDSDFSGFMSAGVSDELRNLALRKLFKAPVFNIRDGLDEYDEDYTTFEKLGDIVTCDMKHHIEMKEQKRREELAAEAEAKTAVETGTGTETETEAEAEAEAEEAVAIEASDDERDSDEPPVISAEAEILPRLDTRNE